MVDDNRDRQLVEQAQAHAAPYTGPERRSAPPMDRTAIDIEFGSGPDAASAARAALSSVERSLEGPVLEDLRLLVSEVVTNSIRHSGTSRIRLRVAVTGGVVRVEVADCGQGFVPAPRAPNDMRIGGWGLYLVDRLADRWGVARDGLTRVWFEMNRSRKQHGAPDAMRFATW